MDLKTKIRDVPHFPKKGVTFKDITPMLGDASALNECKKRLQTLCPKNINIDKVVGVEARGFIMGAMLADAIGAGFVPVRKQGKLPYQTVTKSYELEYGQDTLEMHLDAINTGDNVILHDDVLATGGTARAVCEMVEALGGHIVQCQFIIELDALGGRKKLPFPVQSLLNY